MSEIQRYYLPTGHLVQCTATRIDHDDVVFYPDHVADKAAALAAQAEEHKAKVVANNLSWQEAVDLTNRIHERDRLAAAAELAAQAEEHKADIGVRESFYLNALALRRELTPEPVLFHYEHPSLIVSIDGTEFTSEPCMIHRDYAPAMDRLCTIAHGCGVQLFVTHSVRRLDQVLEDTVVEQALRSNHHAGSAVDLNVVCDGEWFNSKRLDATAIQDLAEADPVRRFIEDVRADPDLRWGGGFQMSPTDPVHFDDNLVLRDPDEWQRRVTAIREESASVL